MNGENVKLKAEIYNYIVKNGGVTYAELERVFEQHGFSYCGDLEIYSDRSDNVVFWTGWNEQALEIISALIREGKIHRTPCPSWVYLVDGKSLTLPVCRSRKDLRRKCWLPTVFNAGKS